MSQRSIILCGTSEKYEYLGKNNNKNENILTYWSVAQAGWNDEKTGGQKSRWSVPLTKEFLASTNKEFPHEFGTKGDTFWPAKIRVPSEIV